MAYLSLSTANLPDPAIDPAAGKEPTDYFNTVLYTGNGSTQSITGVGHQPDFLWFKNRNGTQVHQLFDAVRGVANSLRSNGTDAENTDSPNDRLLSFDSDGFSLGDDGNPNGSTNTYVAWSWKANGSGVSNTDGTITSTVSANTESGFSIVSYTGNGLDNQTVGHGLNQAPDMIIHKNRDVARSWPVYHSSFASISDALFLEQTVATITQTGYWGTTPPSSSVFTVKTSAVVNENTRGHIAYCFHNVEGFSKFGSYTGGGSSFPFVYTGFRPAFILAKNSAINSGWEMWDTARDTYNVVDHRLNANSSADESTAYAPVDILSNGFKLRDSTNNWNGSGNTIIYMAFAENPFKYSNAR